MREEPALLFYFLLSLQETGHTQQVTLTTNYQTAMTALNDAQGPSLFLWSEALAVFLFSFVSLISAQSLFSSFSAIYVIFLIGHNRPKSLAVIMICIKALYVIYATRGLSIKTIKNK